MPTKERLDKIEREIRGLKEKQKANERKITSLEEELVESHRRIKELEAGNPPTSPTSIGDRSNDSFRRKVADIERKCNEIGQKCEQLTKLQTILNGLILKGCHIFQPGTQLQQLQQQLDGAQSNVQDGLTAAFKSSQERIKKHKVPLNRIDYSKLSALESIAGLSDGPANQIGEVVFLNFQSTRKEVIQKLQADGVTPTQAMIDYSSMSNVSHQFPKDTCFFFLLNWYNNAWRQVLFGACSQSLYLLDVDTKRLIKEWKTQDIYGCNLDTSNPRERHIRVELGENCVLKLRSNEMMDYLGIIKSFLPPQQNAIG